MFMCVNGTTLTDDDKLKNFVLNRECNILPDKYKIFIYTTGSSNCRYSGISAALTNSEDCSVFSEIAHRPFGFILTIDSFPKERMAEITDFKNIKFNDKYALTIKTRMIDVIGILPENG